MTKTSISNTNILTGSSWHNFQDRKSFTCRSVLNPSRIH